MFPVLMRFKIRGRGKRGTSLWIPAVLIVIILWALMILLFPLFLLVALLTWNRGPGMRLILVYPLLFSVLWNLSGLHVETRGAQNDFLISFR